MKYTPISSYYREFADSGACRPGGVCVAGVDVPGLSGGGLRDRLKEIGRAESKLGAFKAEVLAELSRRDSKSAAERVAREQLQMSRRDAQRDVEAADRLSAMEETSQALGSGEIPVGHARLIARAASEGPIDQPFLVEAARHQGYDQFAKTMRRHQQEMSDDDGQSIHDRQHNNRTGRAFTSRETGMFILSGEFDPVTGAKIDTALAVKERELWNAEDPNDRRTPQQRMADSTPIPMDKAVRLARDADLLPGVFRAATQEMNLGRKRRTASDAQRAALIYRDKQCIGCGASAHRCFAQHLDTGHWKTKPPTDPVPDNGVDSTRPLERNPVLRN